MSVYRIFPLEIHPTPKSRAQTRAGAKNQKREIPSSLFDSTDLEDDWSVISSLVNLSRQNDLKISDVIWELQKTDLKTLSIEPIFRSDLCQRFVERVRKIRDTYKYPYCPSLGQIDIVFHGTSIQNVESIIKNGFFVPQKYGEDGCGHESTNGQRWGPGIYFTRSTELAAVYGDYQIVFMCAVIMGRAFRFQSYRGCEIPGLRIGYNSHISPDGREGVVFSEDQIVPLCVLQIRESEDMLSGSYWHYERADEEEIGEMCRQQSNRYMKCRGNVALQLEKMLELEMW
jgi:Poly(ADP-ribose) polymerase catalytic domain